MTTRTRRETVYFKHPFNMQGIDRLLPAGPYEIVTDDEMIEGLSFPCFRRVATMIMVPGSPHASGDEPNQDLALNCWTGLFGFAKAVPGPFMLAHASLSLSGGIERTIEPAE